MTITNNILGPLGSDTMRIIFLYVGQGEASLVFMPDGKGRHLSMLIDSNRGAALKGIDLPKLLRDALPKNGDGRPFLDVFANTHPHSDHIGGLEEIRDAVHVGAVWHSGHKPSSLHEGPYGNLAALIREVKQRGGAEVQFLGSRTATVWGTGEVHVLSPAEYIVDDIAGETPDQRDARIHDQCAVLRVGYGSAYQKTFVMFTGDSHKGAWKRIVGYHGQSSDNRVKSHVLSASHHGSYTFFKDHREDPEPYMGHLDAIAPERVIISAPDQEDSKHSHPDDDALERYRSCVGDACIHHMGSRGWSFVVDAHSNGTYQLFDDRGELARQLGFDEHADGGGGGGGKSVVAPAVISRIERSRPMGSR